MVGSGSYTYVVVMPLGTQSSSTKLSVSSEIREAEGKVSREARSAVCYEYQVSHFQNLNIHPFKNLNIHPTTYGKAL